MLIEQGRIEIERVGANIKFIHRDQHGEPRRSLVKQQYMSAMAWKRAIEDWLSNYHEDMPLKKIDGTFTTVRNFEEGIPV